MTPHKIKTGRKPDIAYLHPLRCTAYATIPKEHGTGKIEARLTKCVLIGYYSTEDYKLLDKATNCIIQLCDVIFEEGTFQSTIPAPNDNDDTIIPGTTTNTKPMSEGLATNNATKGSAPNAANNATHTTVKNQPSALLHSPCNAGPSNAAKEAQATEDCIALGANNRLDWVCNNTRSTKTALATTTLTTIWVPQSYSEEMASPDICRPKMDKETERLAGTRTTKN
ncbi:hypothetical protein C0991_004802 [Blastosporella zonata]|nr:hypothetical protein C0991_004802 [Blastosporella zonata]